MVRTKLRTRTASRPRRVERLEARLSKDQKELFLRAAELQGRSLTDFVISSALQAALETVRGHESLRLGDRDRRAFVSALLSPRPAPNALVRAVKRYRERTGL